MPPRMAYVTRLDDLFAPYPEHLSVAQLGEVLGVTTQTAYRWLADGQVPGYKVAGAWVILRDEVKDHVEAGRNKLREESE